jgi:hypothetical protein
MEERELLSFIIGCCVMTFVVLQWAQFKHLPHAKLLLLCFTTLFGSWGFSVIESFFWGNGFNFLQHLFSGVSGVMMAGWCRALYLAYKSGKGP